MKKNYIAPEAKVYTFDAQYILFNTSLNDNTVEGGDDNSFVNEEREDFTDKNVWGAGW